MPRSVGVLLLLALVGCSQPGLMLSTDFCDGLDNDVDGTVDEGRGAAIGCAEREICVAAMCEFECGDGTCSRDASGGEACDSCPADCGACPFCGDGTCTARTGEDCESCSDDCGACPSCGDGTCNGAESCWTCTTDCGLCAGECEACDAAGSCPAGMMCYFVPCTGTLTCGRPEGSACTTWSGASCGSVPVYGRCTTSSQCGAPLTCEDGHCTHRESGRILTICDHASCPYPPQEPAGLVVVAPCQPNPSRDLESYRCVLRCDGGLCPYGMTCTGGVCE